MENHNESHQKDKNRESFSNVPNAVTASIQNLELFKAKSLKMASALHLVTELFSETEPIRGALREQAIALVLIAADRRVTESSESIDNAQYVLDTTLSLISVLTTSRLLSDMNARILIAELESLAALLDSVSIPSAKLSELVLHDLFANSSVVPLAASQPFQASAEKNDFSHNQNVPNKEPAQTSLPSRATATAKPAVSKTPIVPFKKTEPGMSKGDRQSQILSAIQKEGSSIKDIANAVQGCSEKTIQRELNALIGQGRIVREGEKRWSVYKKT